MKGILYIHGKGGSHLEAKQYEQNCKGFDIIGFDYDEYLPWVVKEQIRVEYDRLAEKYDEIYIIANSIGAYFSMLALHDRNIKKALFISPVLDMEKLILDMMSWANVTEEELYKKGEIETDFGEVLSWEYLKFTRSNPIIWNVCTEILYAEKDNLISCKTVENFVATHNANLTKMKGGEHWFHTDEQLDFLNKWMTKVIC